MKCEICNGTGQIDGGCADEYGECGGEDCVNCNGDGYRNCLPCEGSGEVE